MVYLWEVQVFRSKEFVTQSASTNKKMSIMCGGYNALIWQDKCFIHTQRASDPDEMYKIHGLKLRKEQVERTESTLDQLILLCKQELSLLTENQENWQYPLYIRMWFSACYL